VKDLQERQLYSLRKVLIFLDTEVPEDRRLARSRKHIAEAIPRIEALSYEQRVANGLLPTDEKDIAPLRTKLRDAHLIPLARLGKEILQLKSGVDRALRVPKTKATDDEHIAAGDRFAEFLRPHVNAFVMENQPRTFLRDLRSATSVLRERVAQSGEALRRRMSATAELEATIPKARREVPIIEGLLKERLSREPMLAHTWRHAKRIEAKKGRPRKRPRRP
jgi:hypothetical protein